MPIATQSQALWRSPNSVLTMQYGQGYTAGIFKGQEESGWAKKSPYRDVPDKTTLKLSMKETSNSLTWS